MTYTSQHPSTCPSHASQLQHHLMTHQTFVAQLCCATCCATKLRALQPCQMQLQQNAQQTWHQVTQTTMFNYSATLLVGAIANVRKRKRPELLKEVSGHVSGSNSVPDMVLAYQSLLCELKFLIPSTPYQ